MNILSISETRAKLPQIVDQISDGFERLLITVNNNPKAVMIGFDELESLEETIATMAIPGAKESLNEGLKQAKLRKGIPFRKEQKLHEIISD